jgi:hypothetical protein
MSNRTISTFTAGALLASALTFTGMQSWQASAAPGDDDTTFVPVPPCRLFDTRPGGDNVGIRVAPLGPGETFPTQVTGSNGDCVGIPTDATAVAFNITTVSPTADSFLTLFPSDLTTPPKASNLNWVAGQPATPNKVDVKLGPDGKINVFNRFGTVDVIADIVGYYTPSSLAELQSAIVALRSDVDRMDAERPMIIESNIVQLQVDLTGQFRTVGELFINAPAPGTVYVHAQGSVVDFDAGEDVHCTVSTNVPTTTASLLWPRWEASGPTGESDGEGDASVMSVSEVFEVEAGSNRFSLYCKNTLITGTSEFWGPRMFGVYVPD